jgi:hypothetical protein
MKIVDYETSKTLNDVGIVLSRDEAEDLIMYLRKLTQEPAVDRIYLSDFEDGRLEREISLGLDHKHCAHVA